MPSSLGRTWRSLACVALAIAVFAGSADATLRSSGAASLRSTSRAWPAASQQGSESAPTLPAPAPAPTMEPPGAGEALSIFGQEFFRAAPPVPRPEQMAPPRDYVLGPGDTIQVLVWSTLGEQTTHSLVIGPQGQVSMPLLGPVTAAGQTLEGLERQLASVLASAFPQLSVRVSLETLRTITVQVVGEVVRPGTYALPGLATVLNALYEAGGPSERGTMRQIKLVRKGEPARMVDLYRFLLEGSKEQDHPLRDGDTLFVPTTGPRVAIRGDVVRPARFEPTFPTTLAEALAMAGGIAATGYQQRVQVERIAAGAYRVLVDVPAQDLSAQAAFEIMPGDEVTVFSVLPERRNQVEISGVVKRPGTYALRPGMRVSDLVAQAEGLKDDVEAYLERADILRLDEEGATTIVSFHLGAALAGEAEQNLALQPRDRVFIYTPEQVTYPQRIVTVRGAVQTPGAYERKRGMTVSDLIAAAGGAAPEAHLDRGDVIRRRADGTAELIPVDLGRALAADPAANVALEDRDELVVYLAEQVAWRDRTVRIEGAVQRPGAYERPEGMRVSDLVFAAGGLLPEAADRAEIGRPDGEGGTVVLAVKLQDALRAPGAENDAALGDRDVVTIPSLGDYLRRPEVVFVLGEVRYPGAYTLRSREERVSDLIERAGGLTREANPRGIMFAREAAQLLPEEQQATATDVLAVMQWFADRQYELQVANLTGKAPAREPAAPAAPREDVVAAVEAPPVSAAPGAEEEPPAAAEAPASAEGAPSVEPSAMGPPVEEWPARPGPAQVAAAQRMARVSVDLQAALTDTESPENLVLRDGDRLAIPRLTKTVTVLGAVIHPHVVPYRPKESLEYYVGRSGGYALDASREHVIVVRQNGDATPRRSLKQIQPGDTVVVPNTALVTSFREKWERYGDVGSALSGLLSTAVLAASLFK